MNPSTDTKALYRSIAKTYDNSFLSWELGFARLNLEAADDWRVALEDEATGRSVNAAPVVRVEYVPPSPTVASDLMGPGGPQ